MGDGCRDANCVSLRMSLSDSCRSRRRKFRRSRSSRSHGSIAVLPFKVMVDDNFHYMDEDERYEHGTFATVEEAIAACRKLVDQSLADCYKPGMTAAELYDQYTSFGDEPF